MVESEQNGKNYDGMEIDWDALEKHWANEYEEFYVHNYVHNYVHKNL